MSLPTLTLAEARSELEDCLPLGKEDKLINLVCEKLISGGKWKGLTQRVLINSFDGVVTLPYEYETMIGATIDGAPAYIRDPWYEMAPGSRRAGSDGNMPVPIDRGDGFVSFREIPSVNPAGSYLSFSLEDGDDATKEFWMTASRSTGGFVEGVPNRVTINGVFGSPAGDMLFETIESFKKEVTAGRVAVTVSDPNGDPVTVAILEPLQTEVCLRRYSIPDYGDDQVIVALCKRRFTRLESDTDILPVTSIYALRLGLEAVNYEKEGDFSQAAKSWALAFKSLDDALSEHRGSAMRTVPVFVRASAGSKLRSFR